MNQALALAQSLTNEPITHIFSSDLTRAHRTALTIAAHHPHLNVAPNQLLRERDFGELERTPWIGASAMRSRSVSKPASSYGRGESKTAVLERSLAAWTLVLEQTGFNTSDKVFVAIVSHGVFLDALLTTICSLYKTAKPPNIFWSNAAYAKLLLHAGEKPALEIKAIDETAHLTDVRRQRGGVGSLRYDHSQRTIVEFFSSTSKKPRTSGGMSPRNCFLSLSLQLMKKFTDLF
jgi:2,3-bisphosphoglycerate-dependent phosphoglycerate mutase